jgi:hypothetical protein
MTVRLSREPSGHSPTWRFRTLTDNTAHDGSQVEALLDETLTGEAAEGETDEGETDEEVSTVGADGAYDIWDVYEAITDREATPVIPPQKNAKIKKHGNSGGPPLPRDEAIRYIRRHGRKKWKRTHGYHRSSLAEHVPTTVGDGSLSVQRADGAVRGGPNVGKRGGRGEAQGRGTEPNKWNTSIRRTRFRRPRCILTFLTSIRFIAEMQGDLSPFAVQNEHVGDTPGHHSKRALASASACISY